MVSTATSNQLVNQASVMETVKYSQSQEPVMDVPSAVSLEIKELIKEDKSDSGKTIELEKQESSDDTDLITEGTESDKSSLDSSSLSKMAILKEMKVEEHIGEKKIKKKFYWYGNHKLVKPIKDIPPRFQLMLAETNAEKARCEGRPIFLQQDSNPNTSSEATRMSTPFNPEAKCFVPHQPYKVKSCSNEGTNHPEEKESTVPNTNGEMLTPVTVQSVPFNPVPPMYTIHIYSNSTNPTSPTVGPTPVTNPCCMHLPNGSSSMYGSSNNVPPLIQGPPMYYTSHPYTQQTYPTPQYSPGFLTGASATVPQSMQYAPCFAYSQNTQFSSVTLPQ